MFCQIGVSHSSSQCGSCHVTFTKKVVAGGGKNLS